MLSRGLSLGRLTELLSQYFDCRSTLLGATFEQLQAFVNKRIIHISWRVLRLDSGSFIIKNEGKDDDDKVVCTLFYG